MKKFGVSEDKDLKKTAEDPNSGKCPACGGRLVQHGNVILCENCGSEPFEKDEDTTESPIQK